MPSCSHVVPHLVAGVARVFGCCDDVADPYQSCGGHEPQQFLGSHLSVGDGVERQVALVFLG